MFGFQTDPQGVGTEHLCAFAVQQERICTITEKPCISGRARSIYAIVSAGWVGGSLCLLCGTRLPRSFKIVWE